MARATAANVVKSLKAKPGAFLELVRGQGYWYFTYTLRDAQGKIIVYETESVMTMYLSNMPRDRWIADGQSFIDRVEAA